MKIHRFYVPEFVLNDAGVFTLENKEQAHQIAKVLRMKVGDRVQVFNGSGKQWNLVIAELAGSKVIFNIENEVVRADVRAGVGAATANARTESGSRTIVRVYLPLIRKERFEWAVEKLAEIGVESIVPIVTERTLNKNFNIERLNKIAVEASEQSGRVTVPVIAGESVDLVDVAGDAVGWGANKIIVGDADAPSLGDSGMKNILGGKIAILVGPEGGFGDKDLEVLENVDVQKIILKASFGNNILRTETAAIVAAALLVE